MGKNNDLDGGQVFFIIKCFYQNRRKAESIDHDSLPTFIMETKLRLVVLAVWVQ